MTSLDLFTIRAHSAIIRMFSLTAGELTTRKSKSMTGSYLGTWENGHMDLS